MDSGTDFVVEQLRDAPVFQAIPAAELTALAGEVEVIHVNAGGTLAKQGDAADGVYLLVSGRLRAFAQQPDGGEVAVGEIAAGELVGEMSLLTEAVRNATVRAVRDSQLFFVKSATFNRIIHTQPEATLAIARVLVERLERANAGRQTAPPRRAIALVPAYGDCRGTIESLAAVVGTAVDTEVVTSATVAASLGPDHTEAQLTHWLHRVEAGADLVIYIADDIDTPWGHRCLRQADHIVAVDRTPGSIGDNHVIEVLAGLTVGAIGPTVDAVCVHPPTKHRPSGGHRWIRNRHIRVHHIRDGSSGDLDRVARTMMRKDIGLVLSGGGARGLAHIGVLRAFEEASIPIDVAGGTSFGAIVAFMRALDFTWREMRDAMWDRLARPGAPIDLTPPAVAVSKGSKLMKLLTDGFGETQIEDTWLRYFCVSSNLSTGHPLVHSSGNAAMALRASVAIPGVFPPVASGDGEVLVDGAVMNNLPVDVMASFSNGGPIIAANLRAPAAIAAGELPTDGIVSGWKALGRRLNPLRSRLEVPSVLEILTRSSETGGAESARVLERGADFVLHPPTGDHALLDFGMLDELIATGYEYTMAELARWRAAGHSI